MSGDQILEKQSEKIIEAKEITINKLFSEDFVFRIPFYQRPLSWSVDQFEQLLQDIRDSMAFVEGHFLGSILLQSKLPNQYDLIDGQQRLTTLAILMAVIRDITDNSDLKTNMQSCIYQEENKLKRVPESMRIEPWKEMDYIFKKYVYSRNGTQEFLTDYQKGLIKCVDEEDPRFHLFEAISTFHSKLPTNPEELWAFADHMLNDVYMVQMITKSRLSSAFRLFHTLNTAGLDLQPSDILKTISLGEIKEIKNQEKYAEIWQSMEKELGRDILAEIIAYIRTIKKKEKARHGIIDEFEEIFQEGLLKRGTEFIDYVKEIADIYKTKIMEPELMISDQEAKNRYRITIDMMERFIPFSDWIPLLLAFYYKFSSDQHMPDFIQMLEKKVIVEWAAGFTRTERMTSLNKIIKLIEETNEPGHVIDLLLSYTDESYKGRVVNFNNNEAVNKYLNEKLDDNRFYSIHGGNFAKYILLRLDLEKWNLENFPGYPGTVTVEHILPQNPDEKSNWVTLFDENQREEWTNKLGNLVLLGRRKNSKAQNDDFQKKKGIYFKEKSEAFQITRELETIPEWNIDTLRKRHSDLIKNAIEFYSQ